jgi:hypothetical protein
MGPVIGDPIGWVQRRGSEALNRRLAAYGLKAVLAELADEAATAAWEALGWPLPCPAARWRGVKLDPRRSDDLEALVEEARDRLAWWPCRVEVTAWQAGYCDRLGKVIESRPEVRVDLDFGRSKRWAWFDDPKNRVASQKPG